MLAPLAFVAVRLASTAGGSVDPFVDAERSTVLFFLTEECPISRKMSPEMAKIARDYQNSGFRFFAVHVDPATTLARAKAHGKSFRLNFPALLDPTQSAARQVKVSVVPTAVVVSPEGTIRYFGRIDDRFPELGVMRHRARREDLRRALDDIISKGPIEVPRTKAVGCFMPPAQQK